MPLLATAAALLGCSVAAAGLLNRICSGKEKTNKQRKSNFALRDSAWPHSHDANATGPWLGVGTVHPHRVGLGHSVVERVLVGVLKRKCDTGVDLSGSSFVRKPLYRVLLCMISTANCGNNTGLTRFNVNHCQTIFCHM